MTISKLCTYQNITDKCNKRTHIIDTITPHCYVGQCTAKQGVDYFKNNGKENSVNYVIGFNGAIGCSVPEEYRAWTSSSKSNDMRAITIELACEKTKPYQMNDAVIDSLINLMVDICQRNGMKQLVYSTSSSDRKNHKNGANITLHKDFANTSCPGEFLIGELPRIVRIVNDRLKASNKVDWANVKKGDKIVTTEDYCVATSESKAKNGQFAKNINGTNKVYAAGEYYVYKVSGDCVNISKNKLIPGGWIYPQ